VGLSFFLSESFGLLFLRLLANNFRKTARLLKGLSRIFEMDSQKVKKTQIKSFRPLGFAEPNRFPKEIRPESSQTNQLKIPGPRVSPE